MLGPQLIAMSGYKGPNMIIKLIAEIVIIIATGLALLMVTS